MAEVNCESTQISTSRKTASNHRSVSSQLDQRHLLGGPAQQEGNTNTGLPVGNSSWKLLNPLEA